MNNKRQIQLKNLQKELQDLNKRFAEVYGEECNQWESWSEAQQESMRGERSESAQELMATIGECLDDALEAFGDLEEI